MAANPYRLTLGIFEQRDDDDPRCDQFVSTVCAAVDDEESNLFFPEAEEDDPHNRGTVPS